MNEEPSAEDPAPQLANQGSAELEEFKSPPTADLDETHQLSADPSEKQDTDTQDAVSEQQDQQQ